jgi:hypothetical protein
MCRREGDVPPPASSKSWRRIGLDREHESSVSSGSRRSTRQSGDELGRPARSARSSPRLGIRVRSRDHLSTIHRAIAGNRPDQIRLIRRGHVMATKVFDPALLPPARERAAAVGTEKAGAGIIPVRRVSSPCQRSPCGSIRLAAADNGLAHVARCLSVGSRNASTDPTDLTAVR